MPVHFLRYCGPTYNPQRVDRDRPLPPRPHVAAARAAARPSRPARKLS